jgi:hypothetical protein
LTGEQAVADFPSDNSWSEIPKYPLPTPPAKVDVIADHQTRYPKKVLAGEQAVAASVLCH